MTKDRTSYRSALGCTSRIEGMGAKPSSEKILFDLLDWVNAHEKRQRDLVFCLFRRRLRISIYLIKKYVASNGNLIVDKFNESVYKWISMANWAENFKDITTRRPWNSMHLYSICLNVLMHVACAVLWVVDWKHRYFFLYNPRFYCNLSCQIIRYHLHTLPVLWFSCHKITAKFI